MSNIKELQIEIRRQQKAYIDEVLKVLRSDPMADDHLKDYKELEGYLWELIEKDGSILGGLLCGMEIHLEK